jgi:hypothetical protein
MSSSRVTILAGSKAFTSALARPIAERTGEAPRLAADPGQAFALCRAGSAVLVLEYEPSWAGVLRDLARAAKGLRVVAALPPAAADAEPALRALGVRAVRWEGDAGPVLDAVRPAGPAVTPAPVPTLAPRPAATPAPGFFGDVAGVPAASPPAPPSAAAPAPPAAAALWPSTGPGEQDAEHLLCSALAGLSAAGDAALDATIEALTPIETEALQSLASVPEPAPIRRLATLRYRVAFALSTAPPPGSPVDAAGANLLLTEIDEALPALRKVAERMPERAAEMEPIRIALVKQAVDLSEALHRLQPGAVTAPVPAAPDPRRTTGRLKIDVVPEPAAPERKRKGMWITLAVAAALAIGYHGWIRFLRPAPAPPPAAFAAPPGTTGVEAPGAAGRLVIRSGTQGPSASDVEAFRAREEAAGRTVREIAPGVLLSTTPENPGGGR